MLVRFDASCSLTPTAASLPLTEPGLVVDSGVSWDCAPDGCWPSANAGVDGRGSDCMRSGESLSSSSSLESSSASATSAGTDADADADVSDWPCETRGRRSILKC